MDHFLHVAGGENACKRLAIADIGDDETDALGDEPGHADREIVERNRFFASRFEREEHLRADITCAASDEDGHAKALSGAKRPQRIVFVTVSPSRALSASGAGVHGRGPDLVYTVSADRD